MSVMNMDLVRSQLHAIKLPESASSGFNLLHSTSSSFLRLQLQGMLTGLSSQGFSAMQAGMWAALPGRSLSWLLFGSQML